MAIAKRGSGVHGRNWLAVHKEQREFGPDKRLRSHCRNAHGGEFDAGCNACRELKAKAESAQVPSHD